MEIPMIILIQNLKTAKEILINIFITENQRLTNIAMLNLKIVEISKMFIQNQNIITRN